MFFPLERQRVESLKDTMVLGYNVGEVETTKQLIQRVLVDATREFKLHLFSDPVA